MRDPFKVKIKSNLSFLDRYRSTFDSCRPFTSTATPFSWWLAGLFVFAGCNAESPDTASASRFQAGDVVGDGPAAPPSITLVEPTELSRMRVKPTANMPLTVQLSFPSGGRLPIFLMAFIRDSKGASSGNVAFEPADRSGSTYRYKCNIKAPVKPGAYRVDLDSTYLDPEFKLDGEPGLPPKLLPAETSRLGTIEVRR